MLQKTTGIVLHTVKYSDTSNIVDVYTEARGRVSFLIPLSRSKRSTVKPALFQPLSIIEFEADYRPNTSIFRMKEMKAFPFKTIPYDATKNAIALFLAEFLYRALHEEGENHSLFAYLHHSIVWLDERDTQYANFHLVFLMRLSRFLGLYPNLENYHEGDCFDLLNASFVSGGAAGNGFLINAAESSRLSQLMRMNYDTMHLFGMSRTERNRCLVIISDYYQLHIPGFQPLKSLQVLQELFG